MIYYKNFVCCNPHPQGKRVGDCVKRAITIASGINYHDVAIMLNRYKKTTGAKKFNNRDNWKDFVVNVLKGVDQGNMQYANNGRRYMVYEYARHTNNQVRNFVVQVAGHVVAIKQGNYLDTWDSGEKSIYKAWSIPSYEELVYYIKNKYPKLCKGLTLEKYDGETNFYEIGNPKEGVEYWVVVDEQNEQPHYFLTEPQAVGFAKKYGHEIVFHECFN